MDQRHKTEPLACLAEAPIAFDTPVLVFAPAPAAIAFGDNALAPATIVVVISWNILVPAELAKISLVLCLMLKIDDMLVDRLVLWRPGRTTGRLRMSSRGMFASLIVLPAMGLIEAFQ